VHVDITYAGLSDLWPHRQGEGACFWGRIPVISQSYDGQWRGSHVLYLPAAIEVTASIWAEKLCQKTDHG
jgi:hypothetical protein